MKFEFLLNFPSRKIYTSISLCILGLKLTKSNRISDNVCDITKTKLHRKLENLEKLHVWTHLNLYDLYICSFWFYFHFLLKVIHMCKLKIFGFASNPLNVHVRENIVFKISKLHIYCDNGNVSSWQNVIWSGECWIMMF